METKELKCNFLRHLSKVILISLPSQKTYFEKKNDVRD